MAGSNYGGASFYVDISPLQDTLDQMKTALGRPKFDEMLRRTFNDAGQRVKVITSKEVRKEYDVTAAWVKGAIGWPKRIEGNRIGVTIPIGGRRGTIGAEYKIAGNPGRPVKGKRYKINAKILKKVRTTLPDRMMHQGGQPPFIAKGIVRTRKYPDQAYPIVRVVGLGVPQFPINRSKDDIQQEILKKVVDRLQHHYRYLMTHNIRT